MSRVQGWVPSDLALNQLLDTSNNTRDREKAKKRLLRSPRSMGGLARGRVRPDCKEGSRKRNRVAATTEGPALKVIQCHGKSCINWAGKMTRKAFPS